jgi:hypothetical protein
MTAMANEPVKLRDGGPYGLHEIPFHACAMRFGMTSLSVSERRSISVLLQRPAQVTVVR